MRTLRSVAGFEEGGEEECHEPKNEWPLKGGKSQETDCSSEPPKRNTGLPTP